ncbi:zinc-ribbon domain-containing protein [Citreimonas sp.]|uniref:zinc-ribbon domain-containing protein n=1 Tax=Citreimonas sp. TaxID=3036715 RepID=UPI0035C8126F
MSKIRLVCPQCGARYDVPPEVIPPEGRDVQCSHCTHTWFQRAETVQPAPQPREAAAPMAQVAPAEREDSETVWPGTEEARADADRAAPVADDDDTDEDDPVWPGTVPAATGAPEPAPVQPRSLPPEVTEVFRQEREHEARQRAQSAPIESQPDLGLTEPPNDAEARRARAARERMAFVREAETPATPPPAFVSTGPTGSRRDLLPDVEEIRETLRGSDRHARPERPARPGRPERPEPQPEPRESGRGGFLRGFVLAVTVGAIAAAIYVSAPQIIAQQPQAAALLTPYVEAVDNARLWLDGAGADIRAALGALAS